MEDDQFDLTIEHANEVAVRVKHEEEPNHPLVGKEEKLLRALLAARRAHDEALENDAHRREMAPYARRLENALRNALEVLESTPINLAASDPDLDESYFHPESKRDLKGLLRRAMNVLEQDAAFILDRREENGSFPRAIRSHPDKVSTVGLQAAVGVLFDFWGRETSLPFTDEFGKELDDTGNDGPLRPNGPAARLVYEAARLIDPAYTAEACSQAMRPR